MRIGYFDCFSGAAGDMILGALVAAGLDPEELRAGVAALPLDGYEIDVRPTEKQGFAATRVDVRLVGKQRHRHLSDILGIIDASNLERAVRERSKRVFHRLAEAEARVHGTSVEQVHFHEVGAVDAIVDVVGASIGLHRLGLDRIVCSPIPVGSGTVTCEHGVMPVPAPATADLLVGIPLAACEEAGELTTPTGAAILTTVATSFGPLPPMRIETMGFGAGHRDGKRRPNVLRLIVGEAIETDDVYDEVVILETHLDDATGEEVAHACERLTAAGAVDVFTTPITMKKNRPGILLTVMAHRNAEAACVEVIFAETSTFGVRRRVCTRRKLQRRSVTVSTKFGEVRVKVGLQDGAVLKAAPEYDDCAEAARRNRVALREVMDAALAAWKAQREAEG